MSPPRRRWKLLAAVALPIALASCGEDATAPPVDIVAELRIVSGGAVTDTIEAVPATPLVVELREVNGAPLVGALIRFETFPVGEIPPNDISRVSLTKAGQAPFSGVAIDTTDAQGRAQVYVHFGRVAGSVSVQVSAPTLGATATTLYEVRPGAVTAVTVTPSDTALYPGSSYRLTAVGRDRRNNLRFDTPTFTALGAVTVTADGLVTATAIDRGAIIALSGGRADTAYVSVLPTATIVAGMTHGVFPGRASLLSVGLDGSNARFLLTIEGSSLREMNPAWGPLGDRLVFIGPYYEGNVFVVDTSGRDRPLLAPPAGVATVTWPRYSRDGQWTYFSATLIPYGVFVLWRVRPDGTGLEQLTSMSSGEGVFYPSPSPDGGRLAYSGWIAGPNATLATLRILDLATKISTDLGIQRAYGPLWSPVDDRIAYIEITAANATRLHIVHADGSNDRVIADGAFLLGMDWSPDGKWLIVRRNNVLCVISAETGLILPIPYFNQLFQPSWRP